MSNLLFLLVKELSIVSAGYVLTYVSVSSDYSRETLAISLPIFILALFEVSVHRIY